MEWKSRTQAELSRAEAAREVGNEGRARVCARRAAGLIVGEYFHRLGKPLSNLSAINRLQFLADLPDSSPEVKLAAGYFLLRITQEHELPVEVDLIAQARWLAQVLLQEQM